MVFVYYGTYLIGMIVVYAIIAIFGATLPIIDPITRFYAVVNVFFIFTIIWWNARKSFYKLWIAYLVFLAVYFAFLYPNMKELQQFVVFGVAGLNVAITAYDVILCRCKGIRSRTNKRYEL